MCDVILDIDFECSFDVRVKFLDDDVCGDGGDVNRHNRFDDYSIDEDAHFHDDDNADHMFWMKMRRGFYMLLFGPWRGR